MRHELSLAHTDPAEAGLDAAVTRIHALVLEMTERQLVELARMRAVGMRHVELIGKRVRGRLTPEQEKLFGRRGAVKDLEVVTRAVCQIITLELEIAGLRPSKRKITWPPRREDFPGVSEEAFREHSRRHRYDTKEYYDYRPVGEAIDWIRTTLDIEPPPNDPFPLAPANDTADKAETAETKDEIAAEPPALPKRRKAALPANDPASPSATPDRPGWDAPDGGNRRRRPPRGPP